MHGSVRRVSAAVSALAVVGVLIVAAPAAEARSCSFRLTGSFPSVLNVHAYRVGCGWARAIGNEEQSFWASHNRVPRFWGRWHFRYRIVTLPVDVVVNHLVATRGAWRVTMDLGS